MTSIDNSEESSFTSWKLPEKYDELSPAEQAEEMRSAVLRYLQSHGAAAKSVMRREIGAKRSDTLLKALDYLTTTQQIYCDVATGSRDPIYYSNGKLAHSTLQRIIDCGRNQYVIRAYDDRLAGRSFTITQYAVMPSGQTKPLSGIRLDWIYVDELANILSQLGEETNMSNASRAIK